MRRIVAAAVLLALTAACSPNNAPAPDARPEATPTGSATPAASPTPTPEVTATATAAPGTALSKEQLNSALQATAEHLAKSILQAHADGNSTVQQIGYGGHKDSLGPNATVTIGHSDESKTLRDQQGVAYDHIDHETTAVFPTADFLKKGNAFLPTHATKITVSAIAYRLPEGDLGVGADENIVHLEDFVMEKVADRWRVYSSYTADDGSDVTFSADSQNPQTAESVASVSNRAQDYYDRSLLVPLDR